MGHFAKARSLLALSAAGALATALGAVPASAATLGPVPASAAAAVTLPDTPGYSLPLALQESLSSDKIGLPPSRAFEFAFVDALGTDYRFHWNSSASPFMTGLAAGTYASAPDPYLPVYVNGTLVYGQTPSTTLDDSC